MVTNEITRVGAQSHDHPMPYDRGGGDFDFATKGPKVHPAAQAQLASPRIPVIPTAAHEPPVCGR